MTTLIAVRIGIEHSRVREEPETARLFFSRAKISRPCWKQAHMVAKLPYGESRDVANSLSA